MKMSEDERQCLSESRGGSANVISIFSYCARRYYNKNKTTNLKVLRIFSGRRCFAVVDCQSFNKRTGF